MAKKTYVGVSDVSQEVKKVYIGIEGVAHKVTKGYVGDDNGVARLVYQSAIGISSVTLTYNSKVKIGSSISPTITINPTDYSPYQSISYSITSGTSYATIDSSTGKLTGKSVGTVTVKVTIVDALGNTVAATRQVTVYTTYTVTVNTKYGNEEVREWAYVNVDGTTYYYGDSRTAYTQTVDAGSTIKCYLRSANNQAFVSVNGTKVFGPAATYGDLVYTYTVNSNVTVKLYVSNATYGYIQIEETT